MFKNEGCGRIVYNESRDSGFDIPPLWGSEGGPLRCDLLYHLVGFLVNNPVYYCVYFIALYYTILFCMIMYYMAGDGMVIAIISFLIIISFRPVVLPVQIIILGVQIFVRFLLIISTVYVLGINTGINSCTIPSRGNL